MAKLEVRTVPPVPVKPFEEFVLTLTRGEAETVFTLVGSVTGSGTKSRRGYANRVYYALYSKLGVVSKSDFEREHMHFNNVEGMNLDEVK